MTKASLETREEVKALSHSGECVTEARAALTGKIQPQNSVTQRAVLRICCDGTTLELCVRWPTSLNFLSIYHQQQTN